MTAFRVAGKPHGKERARTVRDPYGNVHSFTPKRQVEYEEAVAIEYKAAGGDLINGAVAIDILATFKPPKSTSKARRHMMISGAILPTVRPDLDNVIKSVMDGLNGIAYKDDSQVVTLHAAKVYGEHEGIFVTIEETEGIE